MIIIDTNNIYVELEEIKKYGSRVYVTPIKQKNTSAYNNIEYIDDDIIDDQKIYRV